MHKCVRCGRAATSLQEINDGCPCGSKVFVFNRDAVEGSIAGEGIANAPKPQEMPSGTVHDGNGKLSDAELAARQSEATAQQDGKVPDSYHARMTFSTEDVENIKVLTEGVFALELHSLYKDPVVLKDEEGIYYVKIPFEQNEKALKGFGKKNGDRRQANGKERNGMQDKEGKKD